MVAVFGAFQKTDLKMAKTFLKELAA